MQQNSKCLSATHASHSSQYHTCTQPAESQVVGGGSLQASRGFEQRYFTSVYRTADSFFSRIQPMYCYNLWDLTNAPDRSPAQQEKATYHVEYSETETGACMGG